MNSQIGFVGPEGAMIQWSAYSAGQFDSEPLVAPARYNFPQGALYRLKLTNLPGRPGVELYPTIEVAPAVPRTEAYLAHNAIPIQFTEEDLDQVLSGNFVTKVIFLPDPEFQELAVAGVQELVSTRLDPGQDPIVEADRQGAIMAIIRFGNKDLEVPGVEGGADEMGGSVQAGGGLRRRRRPSSVRNSDHGHSDRSARSSAHSARRSGRLAEAHDSRTTRSSTIRTRRRSIDIHVKQTPGMSYPKPANKVFIGETAFPQHGTGTAGRLIGGGPGAGAGATTVRPTLTNKLADAGRKLDQPRRPSLALRATVVRLQRPKLSQWCFQVVSPARVVFMCRLAVLRRPAQFNRRYDVRSDLSSLRPRRKRRPAGTIVTLRKRLPVASANSGWSKADRSSDTSNRLRSPRRRRSPSRYLARAVGPNRRRYGTSRNGDRATVSLQAFEPAASS